MSMLKTKIKNKKPIQWGKVIVIDELYANEATLEVFKQNLKNSNKDISEEDLNKEVQNLVMKDNYYNKVMDEIASCYEIDFDESELKEKIKILKESDVDSDEEKLAAMAKVGLIKKIIYDDLSSEWNIVVTDELAKSTLENFYKSTGNSIREYLTDRDKFENIKATILEQIISERILNAFKGEFRLKKNVKS